MRLSISYIRLKRHRLRVLLTSLALFLFIYNYVTFKIMCIQTGRKLLGYRDDSLIASVVSHYDDVRVDTSNYINEYIEHENGLSDVADQRNVDKAQYKSMRKNKRTDVYKSHYLIVQYTPIMGQMKYCANFKAAENFVEECPYKNCQFSCEATDASRADALLFSEYDLQRVETEASFYIKKMRQGRPEQIWILWNDEPYVSPQMNYYAFNWTMSYRLDAEISDCAYGCHYHKLSHEDSQFDSFVTEWHLAFYKRKRRAVWAASNCRSHRIQHALRLHKHFAVHVLGRCAGYFEHPDSYLPLDVANFFSYSESLDCQRESDCEARLFAESKFYLSFESRNCTDYITEKFWRILRTGMIPVVLQPSRVVYRQVAPPDSFIHAEDFEFDMERLAAYLHKVSTDFKTYLKHHIWKFEYDVVFTGRQNERRRLCELCAKLNTVTSEIYYSRVADWFESECS